MQNLTAQSHAHTVLAGSNSTQPCSVCAGLCAASLALSCFFAKTPSQAEAAAGKAHVLAQLSMTALWVGWL